jgi:hypothetical protein
MESSMIYMLLTNIFCNMHCRKRLLDWIKFTHSNAKWMKSAAVASELRIQGNEKFKEHDNTGSLILYTESVVHAPRGSEELSLALANRSAALFHLGAYQVLTLIICWVCLYLQWTGTNILVECSAMFLGARLHQIQGDCNLVIFTTYITLIPLLINHMLA